MITDYFILALKNLRKRKLRAWLTMLGIFISIATIFVLISLSLGLQNAVEEQFRQFGTDKIFIQPRGQIAGPGTGGAVELTKNDVEVVEKVIGVKDITWWIIATGEIEFKDEKRFFNIIGFPLDQSDVFIETGFYKADEGEVLDEEDFGKVMIGSQYKYNNVFKRPIKERDIISVNGKNFVVEGILESLGNPADDRLVYMSEEEFREITEIEDRIDTIIAQVEPGEDINEVADRIKRKLLKSRDLTEKTRDFSILTPEEVLETFRIVLNIITAFLLGVAGISLLVGGIGIVNTMYTSVLERTKEIGIMKAVGARNSDIFLIFLIESGLLGLVGGVIGVILGFGISKGIEFIAINQLGTTLLQAAFPFYLVAGSLLFAFVIGALSGALPALQASKLNPVDALRYE
ncbi:MAG: ABC transporter permease [Nanoarchaeota archaeon]|nr:ABC transporter permease [Nanoarchaeota archaeon]